MERIYFDHNATTKTHPEALKAMEPYFCQMYGNASSVHSFGREAHAAMDDSREAVAKLLNAKDPSEIIFTSGGTESNNLALKGIFWTLKDKGSHIITSKVEHHAIINPCQFLETQGARVTYLPVDKDGVVDLDALKKEINDKTILVSIMYANNEVGTIQPVEEISKICKSKGVLFHTDGVQCAGKLPVDVQKLGIDMLSLSGHKFYGPKGIGALYIRKGIKITPLHQGGHHERRLRAGTENIPGIVGMAKACEIAIKNMSDWEKNIGKLRDKMQEEIARAVDFVKVNGHPVKRLYNTLNVSFEYLEGESILLNLDMEGIAAATGSACTSDSLEPSHVLAAMGVPPEISQGSVRFSLGRENKIEEISRLIEVLPVIIKRLREMSPLYADRIKKRSGGAK